MNTTLRRVTPVIITAAILASGCSVDGGPPAERLGTTASEVKAVTLKSIAVTPSPKSGCGKPTTALSATPASASISASTSIG